MQVFGQTYPATIKGQDANTRQICLSYLNPRLADIAGNTIPVRLRTRYGFAGSAYVDDAYALEPDITPPAVAITNAKRPRK